ncbi:hypothetical protein VNI00_015951 [Paramarasmius palmivorus]|uniref:Smr domain-containing protein n=1 Tax=Paramarasmius palmivorus TaxID=297713 RepID=A0AAW0BGE3_9AGAR
MAAAAKSWSTSTGLAAGTPTIPAAAIAPTAPSPAPKDTRRMDTRHSRLHINHLRLPPRSPPHKPSSPPHKPPHGQPDQNQINQSNAHYLDLRKRANEEGDSMAKCFRESQEAYKGGNGARAKELSNEGKEHQKKMEKLNREASEWIYIGECLFLHRHRWAKKVNMDIPENNKDSGPDEVDLHGLYVKEAIEYTDRALEEAKMNGQCEVRLIVGKGLHPSGGVAKIKPAIEEVMIKHQLIAELDPDNTGVLIVQMNT